MKVVLYMATSVNGNITSGKEDSDWVDKNDWKYFNKVTKSSKVMVMGSGTFKQFADDFPQKQALNVVVTSKKELLDKQIKSAIFTNKSPKEVIKLVSSMGYKQMALIGGEKLTTSFLAENLINEIYIDVHPCLIGEGKRLFTNIPKMFRKLKLLGVNKLGSDLVLLHYKVIK